MNIVNFLGDDFEIDISVLQMESVASDLVSLLNHAGLSRVELAKKTGCKKSRITRILSGDENLTLKTLTTISSALGYDFDVVFFNKNYPRPKQPWQIDRSKRMSVENVHIVNKELYTLSLQTGDEVFKDVMSGDEADNYIKIERNSTSAEVVHTKQHQLVNIAISEMNSLRMINQEVTINE